MFANSSMHDFMLIPEATYGTTPATPAFQHVKITGTTLGLTKSMIESETINSNRQLEDVRHGTRQVGGDISVELSATGHNSLLEAVLCGTWDDDILVPAKVRRNFSILRHFTDIPDGAAKPWHLNTGVQFNTLSLNLTTDAMVKASFGVIGRETAQASTAPAGATFVDAPTDKPFDSFSGWLEVDGVAIATVTELTIDLENGIEPRFVLFDDRSAEPKIGKTRVTGSIGLYFEDASFLTAFNGGVKKSLEFQLEDINGKTLTFHLPSILGSGGQPDVQGESDITLTYPFTAVYEAGEDVPDALRITRSAA